MDWSELTRSEWINLVFYGVLALYVASALPKLFRGSLWTALAAVLFWVTAFGASLTAYAYRDTLGQVSERVMAVLFPGTTVQTAPNEVTVFRRPDGQFVVNATVGAVHIPFVLDTGASSVVLRAEEAVKLRIPVQRLRFDVEVATANGRTMTAETELPIMSIGDITQTAVKVLVARPGALQENLLGMSFLNELASFTVARDKLILRGK